uniref:Secretoglobin family 3A member 1 n=1 Tax=Castor canadensis TaxID=51338 RepID=A0A8C0XHJ4_CASCN
MQPHSSCSEAFFMDSAAKAVALVPAAAAVAGAVPNLPLNHTRKFILASLGIPVDHLIEGSKKCVTELGPEAVGAVKTLLGALTLFG